MSAHSPPAPPQAGQGVLLPQQAQLGGVIFPVPRQRAQRTAPRAGPTRPLPVQSGQMGRRCPCQHAPQEILPVPSHFSQNCMRSPRSMHQKNSLMGKKTATGETYQYRACLSIIPLRIIRSSFAGKCLLPKSQKSRGRLTTVGASLCSACKRPLQAGTKRAALWRATVFFSLRHFHGATGRRAFCRSSRTAMVSALTFLALASAASSASESGAKVKVPRS